MIFNQSVLVLNNAYMPLYVTNVSKAINLLFREKAEVVEVENTGWNSHNLNSWEEVSYFKSELEENFKYLRGSDDYILGVPKVIRLLRFTKYNRKINLTRRNIFLRDENTCQYCGYHGPSDKLNIDHVIPKAQGGRNTWTNLVCSCVKCNSHKRDRTPKEAGMELIRVPKKPNPVILFKNYFNRMDEEPFKDWVYFFPDDFVSDIYWNTELK